MRILHLRNSDMLGSPERMIIGQCRHLSKHFEFTCCSFVKPGQSNRFLDECRANEIDVVSMADSFPGDLRLVRHLKRVLSERKIDLIVTHDYKANFYAYFCRRNTAINQIAYFHGVTSENMKVRLYNAIDRFVLKRLMKIIAVSSSTKDRLVKMGIPDGRVVVVPNAVDDNILTPNDRTDCDAFRPGKVVAAGRLSFEKGYDLLIRAVTMARGRAPQFTLYLYGVGPEEKKLRGLVKHFALDEVVKFCGFTDNLLAVFREMDFLVMPSRSEGMPVTVLEAWSQELGVIATRAGGTSEIVEDTVNGLLVVPEDVETLAEKLVFALNHLQTMREYGHNGFQLVKERYTYSKQAQRLRSIYNDV